MWLKPIVQATSPDQHVVCIPWAGAGPECFYPWRTALPAGTALTAVHLPGRSTRYSEPLAFSTAAIVDHVVAEILAAPAPPSAIFGHSFGAILAFEICRKLDAVRQPPHRLVVSGSSAPSQSAANPPVSHLPQEQFLAAIADYGGLTPELLASPVLLDIFTPVLRADFATLESYQYDEAEPLGCPIVVLCGRDDPLVTPRGLQAWHRLTRQRCEIRLFDGNHFFFQADPRGVIAAILGRGGES